MGEIREGDGEAGDDAGVSALQARLVEVVDREVGRQHGALVEEVAYLRGEVARLESDNRKLKLKDETIEATLRQLREGTHAVYYDANGVRRTLAEVTG